MREIKVNETVADQIAKLISETKVLCGECPTSDRINQKFEELEVLLGLGEKANDNFGELTAQVSLYPLKQKPLLPIIEEALHVFKEHGLEIKPGSMSTVIAGNELTLWSGLQSAFRVAAGHGETVMLITVSNACPRSFHYGDHSS